MAISKQNFDFVSAFVEKQAAIVLEPEKEYLVESRLQPLAREEGFTSLDEYVDAVRAAPLVNGRHSRIVDALTTNETTFFRDHFPFEALRKTLLPEHFRRKNAARSPRIGGLPVVGVAAAEPTISRLRLWGRPPLHDTL